MADHGLNKGMPECVSSQPHEQAVSYMSDSRCSHNEGQLLCCLPHHQRTFIATDLEDGHGYDYCLTSVASVERCQVSDHVTINVIGRACAMGPCCWHLP